MLCPALISVRLAPSIFIDDIGERNTADGPEPSQEIADRQRGIRVETGRKAQSRSATFSNCNKASSMSRRGRALVPPAAYSEPLGRWTSQTCGSGWLLPGKERSRWEPHECARPDIPPRRAAVEIALGSCQSRLTCPIPWRNLFIPCALVVRPDSFLDLRIAGYQKPPALHGAALGAQVPASRIFRISSFGTGSGFNRRIDRVVRMISNRSVRWTSLASGGTQLYGMVSDGSGSEYSYSPLSCKIAGTR
jgi:hypothetical protein